jgi:Undecaprenyl-phosphate galactose phosphotransferase WbaP
MVTETFTANRKETQPPQYFAWKSRQAIFEDNSRLWMAGLLIVVDLFSLLLSIFVALQIRQLPWLLTDSYYVEIFSLLSIILVIMFARKGLYPGVGLNYVDELRQITSSTSFAFLLMLSITFVLKTTVYYSRLILIISWLLSLAFIPASRYLLRRLMIRSKLWGEPVVIIGNSQKTMQLVEHFGINLQLGLRPVAVLQDDRCAGCVAGDHTREQDCTIKTQARDLSLRTALIVISDLNEIDRLVERFRTIFHRVILIKVQNGRYGLNGLEALDFSNVLGLQVKNNLLNPWSQLLKRLIDILASAIGIVLLAPLLGLIALSIKLDTGGRVFYRQARLGKDSRPFTLIKFRTMFQDRADKILREALKQNPELKKEWDAFQKLKNDPRVTRVGKILRRFSLDELPQLWNVLRGEMSLVGPRPMMLDQRELYGESFGTYVQVTPGLTGLWQVSGRNETTFAGRAALDMEYIQCWSHWLDIFILFKTIKVVFWNKGAY